MEPAPLESGPPAPPEPVDGGPVEDLEAWLRAASRSDEAAFAAVYDRTAPRVFGLVQRVLRDAQQAEEVTHEVFLEVWETSARFDPALGSVLSWILAIAHRRAVQRARSAEATPPTSGAVRVSGALEALTTSQRRALELAYLGGRSQVEISRLLDLPRGTTTTRIRDALIRLRDATAPSGIS